MLESQPNHNDIYRHTCSCRFLNSMFTRYNVWIRCVFTRNFLHCRGALLLHYAQRQCSFGHELYVWIFSHDPFSPSAHKHSLGERYAKDNLLISLSLQEPLNALLCYLSSLLHHYFVHIAFLVKRTHFLHELHHLYTNIATNKFSVTDSVHSLIYFISLLFICGWLRLERNSVCHGNLH